MPSWTMRCGGWRRACANMGLEPGARIMIRMGNTSDYALLFFGAIAGGYVPLPSSAQLTEEEADFLLADSGARLLAMSEELAIQPPPGVRIAQSDRCGYLRNP
jgi:acyl-CoA synthetase (AMP-forming)/AMP-acid ligase II